MDVDVHRVLIRDHEHALAVLPDVLLELVGLTEETGDDELRAVAPGLLVRVDRLQVRRALLAFKRARYLPARNAGVEAVQDHGDGQPTGVDHPGVPQHVEQLGRAANRLVGLGRGGPDNGRQVVLAGFDRLARGPRSVLYNGKHGALDRLPDRGVGTFPGAVHGLGEDGGVERSALAENVAGAPDHLREDHARVPPRPHERGPRHGLAGLLGAAVGGIGGVFERGFEREEHVGAGIAVRDGVDV